MWMNNFERSWVDDENHRTHVNVGIVIIMDINFMKTKKDNLLGISNCTRMLD